MLFLTVVGCMPTATVAEGERALWLSNDYLADKSTSCADRTAYVRSFFDDSDAIFNESAKAADIDLAWTALDRAAGRARRYFSKYKTNSRKITAWRQQRVAVAVPSDLFGELAAAAVAVASSAEATAAAEVALGQSEAKVAQLQQQLHERDDELAATRATLGERETELAAARVTFADLQAKAAETERKLLGADTRWRQLLAKHDELWEFARRSGLMASGRRPRLPTGELLRNQRRIRFTTLADSLVRVYEETMMVENSAEYKPVTLVLEDTLEHKLVFLKLDGEGGRLATDEPPVSLLKIVAEKRYARRVLRQCPERKARARAILAVYDSCGMTSRMYHEMAQVQPTMERYYVLWQVKKDMNATMRERIPIEVLRKGSGKKVVGVRVDFERKLRFVLELLVKTGKLKTGDHVTVKLSGDGRPVSRTSGHVMLTFSIMEEGTDVCKPNHNYTIAVFEGKEDYKRLAQEFSQIQRVIDATQNIAVGGAVFPVRWVFASDWKFLAEIMGARSAAVCSAMRCAGLKSAMSYDFCPWCLCTKDQRHKVSDVDVRTRWQTFRCVPARVDATRERRTHAEMCTHAERGEHGMKARPLLNMGSMDNVRPPRLSCATHLRSV